MGRLLIELPSEQRDGRSPYGLILLITTLYGLAPFAVYALARLSGDLPSYASWRELSNGLGNHGPWRYTSWQRPLIHFSTVMLLVVLPLFTLVAGLVSRYMRFVSGLTLVAVQLVLGLLVIGFVYWTID